MYGSDFEGPVPVDDEENTVEVEDIAGYLSDEEKEALQQHFVEPNALKEDKMLLNYVIAKTYIAT